jgi:putative phosphoribosyl transferase
MMKRQYGASEMRLPVLSGHLQGELDLPPSAEGLVLFAHGSGSSRKSPRNQFVARILREAGIATLLMDLLTPEEERLDLERAHLRFDIPFLAERLLQATDWAGSEDRVRGLSLGYFGASTGGAAALLAAARKPELVRAVVSRGGRPDLAGEALSRVAAPTLLVVGGEDREVLELNRAALKRLRCEKELRVVPGATHLFEEPGALEEVARVAAAWFRRHLGSPEWVPSPGDRLDTSVRGE